MPIPTIDPENLDSNSLKLFIEKGIAYIPTPENIDKQPETITSNATNYFNNNTPKEEQDIFQDRPLEGYIDQGPMGYDIKRYIVRHHTPKVEPLKHCAQNIFVVKNYFIESLFQPLLIAILNTLNIDEQIIKKAFEKCRQHHITYQLSSIYAR